MLYDSSESKDHMFTSSSYSKIVHNENQTISDRYKVNLKRFWSRPRGWFQIDLGWRCINAINLFSKSTWTTRNL